MAASVIAAVLDKFDALTAAAGVPAYFDSAPAVGSDGSTAKPPYLILKDDGTTPEYDFEHNPIEVTRFRLEIYHIGLAEADAVAAGVRYNGGGIAAGSGFDFASALTVTGQTLLDVARDREQRFTERSRSVSADNVYRVSMAYTVRMLRTA